MVSPGLPTVMGVDGCTGRERDLRRAAGRRPIGRVLTVAGAAAIVVTWPGR